MQVCKCDYSRVGLRANSAVIAFANCLSGKVELNPDTKRKWLVIIYYFFKKGIKKNRTAGIYPFFFNFQCYIPAWYISCDFQLSILGLLILWCWKKDQRKGVMMFSAALIASILIPAFLTYWHRLSLFLLYDLEYVDIIS